MSRPSSLPLKPLAAVAFLASVAAGWNIAPSRQPSAVAEIRTHPPVKRILRSGRPVSPAEAGAGVRMASLRAMGDPEDRLLATIAVANSIAPVDIASWIDGGLFNLRGGPELMIFTRILMERWQTEDPEGLLAWAVKNGDRAGDGVLEHWAATDPQRLSDWFKGHRDDGKELMMLAKVAEASPEAALQRLKVMASGGLHPDAGSGAFDLMTVLASKSQSGLLAMLDSLPPDLKFQAEGAMSKIRLEASFSEEIQNLALRPDGWKLYSTFFNNSDANQQRLIDALADLPRDWKIGISLSHGA